MCGVECREEGRGGGGDAATRVNNSVFSVEQGRARPPHRLWSLRWYHVALRVYPPPLHTGAQQVFCGTGNPGFGDGACSSARFREPRGMAMVGGLLFVADAGNYLVRTIDITASTC